QPGKIPEPKPRDDQGGQQEQAPGVDARTRRKGVGHGRVRCSGRSRPSVYFKAPDDYLAGGGVVLVSEAPGALLDFLPWVPASPPPRPAGPRAARRRGARGGAWRAPALRDPGEP